jgi:dTDP-4-dehydrorhamnose reductase
MNRTFLFGAGGMLAGAFRKTHPDYLTFSHSDLDLTDYDRVRAVLREQRPKTVINCAAYTNVTRAEEDPAAAFAINGTAAGNLAQTCHEVDARLVHLGTDFIFPGRPRGNYREDEPTEPVNRYGASKLDGERRIAEATEDYLILRISWLYGNEGRNFVSTIGDMLRQKEEVRIVADQYNKTTYALDVVRAVDRLLELNASGIYHFANEGVISRFDFTLEIARLLSEHEPVKCRIVPIPASEYPDPTPRPVNSSLNCSKYERFTGWNIPDWKDALKRMMGDCPVSAK